MSCPYTLGVAVDLLIALPVLAFGIWRLAVGLNALGLTSWQVPDHNPNRYLPPFMRSSRETYGAVAVVGGVMFIGGAVMLVVTALQ